MLCVVATEVVSVKMLYVCESGYFSVSGMFWKTNSI